MTPTEIKDRFTQTGALLEGHFLLRSGLHSDKYFQAAQLMQRCRIASELCGELAARFQGVTIETVISPAVGGIVVGQEVGRHLDVRAIFAEKDDESNLLLRRGFSLAPGEKVLVAEDVITKGGRVQQTLDVVRACGAEVVGVAVLVDRSDGTLDFGTRLESLVRLSLATYTPEDCPLCRQGLALVKPGSK